MKVVYIQRKPDRRDHFSIENSFAETRQHLPPDIESEVFVPHFSSRGILRRLLIAGEAAWSQGDINHITGDIHFTALALRTDRTVLTIHDCGFLRRTSGLRRLVLKEFWYRLPVRNVAAITTVSQFTKSELLSIVPCAPSMVHVIPTCISSAYRPVPKPRLSTPPVILQVGTKPNKNLERVAQALEGLFCVLVIVGQLTEAQRQVLARHRLTYRSFAAVSQADLIQLYIESDVVSFISTYEGFGMPVIEAQSVGRPVIAGNVSSLPEVGGSGSCLVDPYDVEAIREAFQRVLTNQDYRHSLVEAGFANRARFSAATVAQQYASLYRSICDSSRDWGTSG